MTSRTKFSIGVSLLTLFCSTFCLLIMSLIPVLGAIILLWVDLFFWVVLIINMVYLLKNLKHNLRQALLPLVITLGTLGIIMLVFVFDVERKMNFYFNLEAREEVISLITSGKLKNEGRVKLPKEYRYLSEAGWIEIESEGENLLVRFDVYGGFPGEFEGIIYSANNHIPKKTTFFSRGSTLRYSRYEPKWFWYLHD